jgi:hypothetical protein
MEKNLNETSSGRQIFFDQSEDGRWRTVFKTLGLTALIYVEETVSYFKVAEYFGKLAGIDNTLNLQLPIDRITPWFTPLFAFYIPWPFIWYFVIPICVLGATGKKGFSKYTINAFLMYSIASIIYMIMPTTTTPADFIDGTIMALPADAPFHDTLVALSQSGDNIWGSFPSYHNYWASLLVLFALAPDVRWFWRYPMIIAGVLISLSTLTLHQHCLLDVILTYAMTGIFLAITVRFKLDEKLLRWFEK